MNPQQLSAPYVDQVLSSFTRNPFATLVIALVAIAFSYLNKK